MLINGGQPSISRRRIWGRRLGPLHRAKLFFLEQPDKLATLIRLLYKGTRYFCLSLRGGLSYNKRSAPLCGKKETLVLVRNTQIIAVPYLLQNIDSSLTSRSDEHFKCLSMIKAAPPNRTRPALYLVLDAFVCDICHSFTTRTSPPLVEPAPPPNGKSGRRYVSLLGAATSSLATRRSP